MKSSGLTILQTEQALQQDSTNVSTDDSVVSLVARLAKMKAAHSSGLLRRQFHAIVASEQVILSQKGISYRK